MTSSPLSPFLIFFASFGLGWGALSAMGILYVASKRWDLVLQGFFTLLSFWFLVLTLVPFTSIYVWYWLANFGLESPGSFIWFLSGGALAVAMLKRSVGRLK